MKCAILINDSNNFPPKIQKAHALANELQLPVVDIIDKNYEIYLVVDQENVKLWIPSIATLPYQVNFNTREMQKRLIHWHKELLIRACGIKNKFLHEFSIVDATGGFGRDAFLLASAFHKVYVLEQNPIVANLLEDGFAQIQDHTIKQRLFLIKQNSVKFLSEINFMPEVIYLDPMFEGVEKRAKVKKNLQLLQALCDPNTTNAENLLVVALQKATQRVVIKRAIHAPYLASLAPSYSLKGKDSRFDVYMPIRQQVQWGKKI